MNTDEGRTVMAGPEGIWVIGAEANRFYDGIGGLWCAAKRATESLYKNNPLPKRYALLGLSDCIEPVPKL